jgi:hypothetical protein
MKEAERSGQLAPRASDAATSGEDSSKGGRVILRTVSSLLTL